MGIIDLIKTIKINYKNLIFNFSTTYLTLVFVNFSMLFVMHSRII